MSGTGPIPITRDDTNPVLRLPEGDAGHVGLVTRVVYSDQLPPGSVRPEGGVILGVMNGTTVLVVDSALSPVQRAQAFREARRGGMITGPRIASLTIPAAAWLRHAAHTAAAAAQGHGIGTAVAVMAAAGSIAVLPGAQVPPAGPGRHAGAAVSPTQAQPFSSTYRHPSGGLAPAVPGPPAQQNPLKTAPSPAPSKARTATPGPAMPSPAATTPPAPTPTVTVPAPAPSPTLTPAPAPSPSCTHGHGHGCCTGGTTQATCHHGATSGSGLPAFNVTVTHSAPDRRPHRCGLLLGQHVPGAVRPHHDPGAVTRVATGRSRLAVIPDDRMHWLRHRDPHAS